jgi:hypothetical protein
LATVGELLKRVTDKLGLQIDDYFLYFDSTSSNAFVPNQNEKLNNLVYKNSKSNENLILFYLDLFIN